MTVRIHILCATKDRLMKFRHWILLWFKGTSILTIIDNQYILAGTLEMMVLNWTGYFAAVCLGVCSLILRTCHVYNTTTLRKAHYCRRQKIGLTSRQEDNLSDKMLREHLQKTFVTLNRFWLLRGWGFGWIH